MKKTVSILLSIAMLMSTVNVFAAETSVIQSENIIDQNDSYTRSELHVDNNGADIYGELYLPETTDETVPLVILTHGLGGTCAGGERYATQFAEMGIATYCYDLRFASEDSRSNNDTTQLSPGTVRSDLQAVIDTSKTWDFVDTDNVFLMGYSLGGLTTAITAPDNMDYIKAEIMFYPAFVIQDMAAELAAMGDDMPETFELTGVTLGKTLIEDTINYDLYAQAEKFNKDALLIHGDADTVVPISYSETLSNLLPSVEYHVIKDGVHSFQGEHFVEAMTYVKDFLYREINEGQNVITLQIDNPTMYVNGMATSFGENDTMPRLSGNETLLPICGIMESLGGSVEWNEENKSATINYNGSTVVFTLGSNEVTVNGQSLTTDSAPEIINNRIMLPIRTVSDTLGLRLEWSEPTQTITIIS